MNALHAKHRTELARAIRNRHYDRTEAGILVRAGMNVLIGGAMKSIDYRESGGGVFIDHNLLTNEGLNHILNCVLPPAGGYAQITSWFVAPFAGNYNPTGALTAANFTATATELLTYTSATRPALTIAAATSTESTGNTGSEAQLIFNATSNVYGGAIISASAKSAITGKLLAAVRFASPRLAMAAADKLGLEYVLTAADAG